MELLEKETFYYKHNDHLIEPVHCAFFKEDNNQGITSHQEAVLAFLTYFNRVWCIWTPKFVPGLTQKFAEVPKVEVTLTPEVEARIEAGVDAQIKGDIQGEIKYLQAVGRKVDLKKLQIDYEERKQERYQMIKELRKEHEALLIRFLQLYERTEEVTLTYMEETSFDTYDGFPIRVNPEMMKADEISSTTFFSKGGEYQIAFCSYLQTHRTIEDFQRVNQLLFPDRSELVIYQWNTDFTSLYNEPRRDDGAYLWSIYDKKRKRFTVIDIALIIP
ncbi:hypothetical protein GUJ50_11050 [Enterococcus hirae]|uniref:hypothetical protein n=1 Tax=Enterococcus hirae TaxID=1354 RepID=UPI001371BE98|nr:hypothetical protein [Enterococcus hirae]NAB56017.1 hypothetical protein [Enterococcus hirae]